MEPIQHELYEYARDRIKQKKGLFYHFILLCVGSLFIIIANKWLGFYPEKTWWTWAVTTWFFLFILHVVKVFVINNFMNKNNFSIKNQPKTYYIKLNIIPPRFDIN